MRLLLIRRRCADGDAFDVRNVERVGDFMRESAQAPVRCHLPNAPNEAPRLGTTRNASSVRWRVRASWV